MSSRCPRLLSILAVYTFAWLANGSPVHAQYNYIPPGAPGAGYFPPGPYPPGYGYPPYGGYWQGQASMIDAYGNLGKDQEQARILREQANQAKLDTKVKTIDVMAYERANKYWYSDEQADIQAKRVEAAMNNPPLPEVTSGRALNTLLPWLDAQMVKGTHGNNIVLDPDVVKQMNVASGASGGNAGLLKDINDLPWPVATIGPNQKKLDAMLRQATYDAAKGPVSPTAGSDLKKQTELVSGDVSKKYQKSEIDAGEYVAGSKFLDQVREAVKALQQPSITKILGGQSGIAGNSVEQVVYSMSSKGLTFASAQPGHEDAYVAMHRAFVNYGLSAGTADTGFRVRVGSLPGPGPKPPTPGK